MPNQKLWAAGATLLTSMRAHADRYGIDESMGGKRRQSQRHVLGRTDRRHCLSHLEEATRLTNRQVLTKNQIHPGRAGQQNPHLA